MNIAELIALDPVLSCEIWERTDGEELDFFDDASFFATLRQSVRVGEVGEANFHEVEVGKLIIFDTKDGKVTDSHFSQEQVDFLRITGVIGINNGHYSTAQSLALMSEYPILADYVASTIKVLDERQIVLAQSSVDNYV